ncbi:MAG: hypothetical protein EOO15_22055 [Chitinophagaceae bacterium]|nr:MAG: hypothetical protein EOO15_22055 [Chitinophagaceae bacterium]
MAEHAQAGHTPSPGRVAAPIMRRLDQAYVDSLNGAHSNSFYRLRVSSALLLLEASLLLLQGRREDKNRRFWSEVAAGALTSAAAGMELLAVGTEQALASLGRRSASARGASISLGRYRIWGAALAGAGGLVSIALDVADVINTSRGATSSKNRRTSLTAAYAIRAGATSALILGQAGAAFAQAGPLFEWLALRNTGQKRAFLQVIVKLSAQLAANKAANLLLSRMIFRGGWVILAATALIVIIDDNALEKWCSKCCFRTHAVDSGYETDHEELSELFSIAHEDM